MAKEGCDVKIANTKTIRLNDLSCFVMHDQKHDNRVAVEARILYFLEEDIGQSASVLR
jgi:hypothetical protein